MGNPRRTGVERYVMGSVTEQVVRRAGVPVLSVRVTEASRRADAYDEIMIPTDGSESADAAVEPALELATRFDARVHAGPRPERRRRRRRRRTPGVDRVARPAPGRTGGARSRESRIGPGKRAWTSSRTSTAATRLPASSSTPTRTTSTASPWGQRVAPGSIGSSSEHH